MKTELQTPTKRTTLAVLVAVACTGAFFGNQGTAAAAPAMMHPPVILPLYTHVHSRAQVLRPTASAFHCPVRVLLSTNTTCGSTTTQERKPRRFHRRPQCFTPYMRLPVGCR